VFSTDEKQIGENKGNNAGFVSARNGKAVSSITFRERFDAFEGVLNNRNLIASYIPVRASPETPVEGVFEVYSDVTELLHKQTQAQWRVAALVLGLLALLYLFLYLVVRKADGIISRQEQDRAAKEELVRHQAYHDALTGLPNRAYFGERLHETLSHAARHGHAFALMFVDLDRFKIVNDSLGHQAGDALLRVVSERIHCSLRASDLLFRMGGDEFTIILAELAAPEDADGVARRILEAVTAPVTIHEHELRTSATIGIAVYPGDGDSPDELLRNADAAMYSAKATGRGTHAFYRSQMNQRALQRLNLEVALRKGFRDGEFTLHYQPRFDAGSRRVVAVEALLRWASPQRGLVLPADFLGVLEDTGMMAIVGEWVLRSACAQAARWHAAGLPLRVSVNISPLQFRGVGFAAMMQRVLVDTGAPPSQLELELTETMLLGAHAEAARATVSALKALGLRLSIDHFGTGFSSLQHLRRLAFDFVKVDPASFAGAMSDLERDHAVAAAIVQLAHALDIAVVAKNVETDAQANFFRTVDCAELQGHLLCTPLALDQLERFLADPASRHRATPTQPAFL
jgi:diguanylate cyclase (GGDEF)-like protein